MNKRGKACVEKTACLTNLPDCKLFVKSHTMTMTMTSGTVPLSRPAHLPFHMSAKYKARIQKKNVLKPFYTVRAKSRMELNNFVSYS